MSFTNMVLGGNWGGGDWPERIDVSHEVGAASRAYVPERTCRDIGGTDGTNAEHYDFGCSACGYCCDLPEPDYCPGCGARVVER